MNKCNESENLLGNNNNLREKIDKLEDMSMEKANEIILKLKKKGEEKNEING